MVTVHAWYALSMAVLAVSVSVAVAVPVSVLLAVKAVLPHPLMLGAANVPNWKSGRTSAMLSLGVPVSRGVFNANMNVMEDSAAVTGLAMRSLLFWNAAVGATTWVDAVMDPLAAAMSVAEASATATVRVFRLAACAHLPVVTPVPTVTVHSEPAPSVAVAVLSVSVAAAVPEPVAATLNVVLPHPVDELMAPGVPSVNVGSTRAMVSVVTSRGAFSSTVYEMEDGDHVDGSAMVSMLVVSAGATVTVDVAIFTAAMSVGLLSANVTAAVRPLRSAT